MNSKLLVASAVMAASTAVGAQGQSVILNFQNNADFEGSLSHSAAVPNGTVFSSGVAGTSPVSVGLGDDLGNRNGVGRGTFAPFELTGVDPVTGAAVSGFYTASFTFTTNTDLTDEASSIGRSGQGIVEVLPDPAGIGAGESLTASDLTLNFVSGDDVFQAAGFSGLFIGLLTAPKTSSSTASVSFRVYQQIPQTFSPLLRLLTPSPWVAAAKSRPLRVCNLTPRSFPSPPRWLCWVSVVWP